MWSFKLSHVQHGIDIACPACPQRQQSTIWQNIDSHSTHFGWADFISEIFSHSFLIIFAGYESFWAWSIMFALCLESILSVWSGDINNENGNFFANREFPSLFFFFRSHSTPRSRTSSKNKFHVRFNVVACRLVIVLCLPWATQNFVLLLSIKVFFLHRRREMASMQQTNENETKFINDVNRKCCCRLHQTCINDRRQKKIRKIFNITKNFKWMEFSSFCYK